MTYWNAVLLGLVQGVAGVSADLELRPSGSAR